MMELLGTILLITLVSSVVLLFVSLFTIIFIDLWRSLK